MKNIEHTFPKTYTFFDDNGKAFAHLVIDSEIDGRACGGIRMAPDLPIDELNALARMMTNKFTFVGIGLGGAKSGILGDPEAQPALKKELLQRFGRMVSPWLRKGKYIPGVDFGTSDRDLRLVLSAAGVPKMPQVQPTDRAGEATALTVFVAMQTAGEMIGVPLKGANVAVEGFGSVGSVLANIVAGCGARIVAVSTSQGCIRNSKGIDVALLDRLRQRAGSGCIKEYRDADYFTSPLLATLDVDVYAPCARTYSIDRENAVDVKAKLVCGGSNLQVLPGVEKALHDRSIFYVPPYAANCGGVFWGAVEIFGLSFEYYKEIVKSRFRARVQGLFEEAIGKDKTPLEIADEFILRRFHSLKAKAESKGIKRSVWKLGRAANDRRLVPLYVKRAIGKKQVGGWLSH